MHMEHGRAEHTTHSNEHNETAGLITSPTLLTRSSTINLLPGRPATAKRKLSTFSFNWPRNGPPPGGARMGRAVAGQMHMQTRTRM